MNILVQHTAIEELDKKVKSVEEENITLNARVESLESWICKQAEEIKTNAKHIETLDASGVIVKENVAINVLEKKFVAMEIEINGLKLLKSRRIQTPETSSEPDKVLSKGLEVKCKICSQTFNTNCDFEKHMVESHEAEKTFKCGDYGNMQQYTQVNLRCATSFPATDSALSMKLVASFYMTRKLRITLTTLKLLKKKLTRKLMITLTTLKLLKKKLS